METLEECLGSNDHSIVLKGKRTKRQRPSPSSAALSSSGDGGRGGGSGSGSGGGGGEFYSFSSSPTTSNSANMEEDEDMANCLILLAQGGVSLPKTSSSATKDSVYVYECKTCNRSFPSFQALGGHRASHKKNKPSESDRKESPVDAPFCDLEEEEEEEKAHKTINGYNNNKPKIHECSICGLEFPSGQALGGHMRRHRSPNITTRVDDRSLSRDGDQRPRNVLGLDLNLPAPVDDDRQPETKFRFSSNHQGLVFSAVALVDCQY